MVFLRDILISGGPNSNYEYVNSNSARGIEYSDYPGYWMQTINTGCKGFSRWDMVVLSAYILWSFSMEMLCASH